MGEHERQDPTPPVPVATVRQIGILAALVGAFEAVITWLGGLYFFGLVPAWRISQSDPQKTLKGAFRSACGSLALRRMRNALVVLEFALAIVLLTGAGLLVRSFLALEEVDLGFQPERLLTMRVTMPADVSQPRTIALH